MLAPVVRMRDLDVGPRASSNATHARDMQPKIAPEVWFTHSQNAAPSAANETPGMINRNIHQRLDHTMTDSKSRK
jgi:hypothetical protein